MGGEDEHGIDERMLGCLLHMVQHLLNLLVRQEQAFPKGTLLFLRQAAPFDDLLDLLLCHKGGLLFGLRIPQTFGWRRAGQITLPTAQFQIRRSVATSFFTVTGPVGLSRYLLCSRRSM